MNCYECIYAGQIAGDCHLKCNHPDVLGKNSLFAVSDITTTARYEPFNLSVSHHGLKNGWAFWPLNFDPIWVEKCSMFQSKGGEG